jgi:hypothetical protein
VKVAIKALGRLGGRFDRLDEQAGLLVLSKLQWDLMLLVQKDFASKGGSRVKFSILIIVVGGLGLIVLDLSY